MIVPGSQLSTLLDDAKRKLASSEDRAMQIFVANGDVDSLAAFAVLESMTSKVEVITNTIPVENYEDIRRHCQEQNLDQSEDNRVVVLINCGATESIQELCSLSPNVRVIIIDSHRPVYHKYTERHDLQEPGGVFVVVDEDDPVPHDIIPRYDAELEDEQTSADMDGSQGSDQEEEGGDGSQGSPLSQGDERPAKRRRREERHSARRAYQEQVDDYYLTKSGYGKPSAMLMFNAAYQLQLETNYTVWLAILGMTDQFIHQRVDPLQYEQWRRKMEDHVAQLNGEDGDGNRNDGHSNNRARHKMVVQKVENELRLPLLRHWTLRDALIHTHHVATRLCTWRETGKKQVDLLLAACNVGRPYCEGVFSTMHPRHRQALDEKFLDKAAAYGLSKETLKYTGFELRYKNDIQITAIDYVLALTAHLGRRRVEGEGSEAVFLSTIDALHFRNEEGIRQLRAAIDRAKALAVKVVEEGGLLVTRRQVQGGKHDPCWYLDLSNMTFQSSQDFHHHSTLVRLALFVRDAWTQRVKQPQSLVVIGPPDANDLCHVVSVRKCQQAGQLQNNPLAIPFQEVLSEHTNDDVSQATFDNTIYTIKRAHVYTFVEELRALIKSYNEGGDMAGVV